MRKFTLILLLLLIALAQAAPATSLADVNSFDNSRIGAAGSASPNYEAFKAEYAKGQKAIPIFEKCLKEGKPAARIYSAIGLYGLDKKRGLAALEALKSDQTRVRTMSGCLQMDTTIGEVVTNLLANDGEGLEVYLPDPEPRK